MSIKDANAIIALRCNRLSHRDKNYWARRYAAGYLCIELSCSSLQFLSLWKFWITIAAFLLSAPGAIHF